MEDLTPLQEFARELRKARLAKKWRPRDLARCTRIQYEYIKKMEAGEFSFMPEPIIRGFIRSYARDVGLDQEEMIARFDRAKLMNVSTVEEPNFPEKTAAQKPEPPEGKKEKIAAAVAPEKPEKEEAKKKKDKPVLEELPVEKVSPPEFAAPEKDEEPAEAKKDVRVKPAQEPSGKKSTAITSLVSEEITAKEETFFSKYRGEILLGFLLALIVAAVIFVYLKFGTDYFSAANEPVKKITVFEARKQNLGEKSTPVKPKSLPRQAKATLRVVAAETTWVRVIKDGKDTTQYIFNPGKSGFFEAQNKLELKMGRADGLLLWVNGDSVGTLGPASEIVARLIITKNGIITKNVRPPLPVKKDVNPDSTSRLQE
ncbi:MAG TPA: helix-turn-helix domain-containing protein [Bacteroidetes bacterium]|nr:helix-turn-helix domain-containing protein [Bacteroidota bacterium]